MSFLTRTTLRTVRATPVARFSTTAVAQKSPVDAATDTLKKVDRTVSDAAVSGIEAGEKAAASARQTAGIKTEQAKQEAGAAADSAAQQAKGTANEAAKKAEGAAQQAQAKTK